MTFWDNFTTSLILALLRRLPASTVFLGFLIIYCLWALATVYAFVKKKLQQNKENSAEQGASGIQNKMREQSDLVHQPKTRKFLNSWEKNFESPDCSNAQNRLSVRIHLNCAQCGQQLTSECFLGEDSDYLDDWEDGESPIQPGIIVIQQEKMENPISQNGKIIGTHVESESGDYSVNPNNILSNVLISTGKDNGCCGSDGSDGPNRRCACGAVLGTEWSDCWTQAEVRFISSAVVAQTA